MAVETELRKRKKLSHVNTIEDVVSLIQNSNHVIVLAGAGVGFLQSLLIHRNQH